MIMQRQVPTILKIPKTAETQRYRSCTNLLTRPLLCQGHQKPNNNKQCSFSTSFNASVTHHRFSQ